MISQAPLSSPIADKFTIGMNWLRWFTLVGEWIVGMTTVKQAVSSVGTEVLTYVYGRPIILYTYTGSLGGTWNIDSTLIVIPPSTAQQTTSSFVLIPGDNNGG